MRSAAAISTSTLAGRTNYERANGSYFVEMARTVDFALPDRKFPPAYAIEVRNCAKREVSSIDEPPKPKVDVQEAIANAKVYCKQNPESFVSLRNYSGGIYNQTCSAFAAEQQVADPTYKIGSD
jgi:hypothetical protein